MTQPLLGQRSRTELIAELYDRHAAGLFAYAHDQLGDAGSASDVLVAVLSNVSDTEPPRAALYALARREIYQRDIVYSPPVTGLDPVATLVQRVLADLRTHQREVLYLSGVCEMDAAELSWVLDVAADTADELTVSACRRLSQSLSLALASARIPGHLAEVFGALAVAPVRDVLNLAPWATPPARLRSAVLGPRASIAPAIRRPMAPLVRQLWPTTPQWPLPSAENGTAPEAPFGPLSGAPALPAPEAPEDRFPDPFAPPDPDVLSAHEASTEPMPKLGDSVLTALDAAALRPRRRLQRPRPRRAAPMPAPIPGDVLDDAPGRQDGQEDLFRPPTPQARAARAYTDRLVATAPRDGERPPGEHVTESPFPALGDRTGSGQAGTLGGSGRARPLVPFEPAGASGDVLDDLPAAHPLPGWPLQTDQLDALAADERERHARPSSPAAPSAPSVPVASVTPVPPAPTAPIPPAVPAVLAAPVPPAPLPSPASQFAPPVAPPVVPSPDGPPASGTSDPVRPHAVDWFADTSSGAVTGEMPTALPLWTPRPDHLSAPANQARFRLPSWVVCEDHLPEDLPSGAPLRPVPQNPTPTPYETRHDGWTTAPVDVPAAALPALPAPPAAPAPSAPPVPPPGPALPPEFPWNGRTEAPRPEPAEQTTTRTGQPAPSPSGRAASHRRGSRASHARRTKVKTSHHDWAWEVAGFVIAVAIAMIVFFAVPMMTAP
ncbi:RNA polymerase sigma factor [Streptosporangium sp. NPDC050855]|uniref:RNA polymerase sigma factor n=1 Tax=Streptosporangium sp. NPDC050855 TaxID=3366194 RepID=UPI00379DBA34